MFTGFCATRKRRRRRCCCWWWQKYVDDDNDCCYYYYIRAEQFINSEVQVSIEGIDRSLLIGGLSFRRDVNFSVIWALCIKLSQSIYHKMTCVTNNHSLLELSVDNLCVWPWHNYCGSLGIKYHEPIVIWSLKSCCHVFPVGLLAWAVNVITLWPACLQPCSLVVCLVVLRYGIARDILTTLA